MVHTAHINRFSYWIWKRNCVRILISTQIRKIPRFYSCEFAYGNFTHILEQWRRFFDFLLYEVVSETFFSIFMQTKIRQKCVLNKLTHQNYCLLPNQRERKKSNSQIPEFYNSWYIFYIFQHFETLQLSARSFPKE